MFDQFATRQVPYGRSYFLLSAHAQDRRDTGEVIHKSCTGLIGMGLLLAQGISVYEQATNLVLATGAFAGLAASVARDDPAWAKAEADWG